MSDGIGIGIFIGTCVMALMMAFVVVPATDQQSYENGVKDCMNGKANVTIANDTTIVMP